MISTGVVRKIDDLGRIVIPKEIRKSLGIRDGENLEILIEGNNIKLTKNNVINNYLEYLKKIVEASGSIIAGHIIITDREKVLCSNDSKINKGDVLSERLLRFIDERSCYNDNNLESFEFASSVITGYFLLLPIISDGDALGLVIIYNSEKKVDDYYLIAKLISTLIARETDITC